MLITLTISQRSSDSQMMLCRFLHREEDVKMVVEMALKEAGASETGLTFKDVAKALEGSELSMDVEMPKDY